MVTDCVLLAMTESCGARVAVTSCDTSELTSMTEPPAAAALLPPATEMGVVVLLTVAIDSQLRRHNGARKKPQGGRLSAPAPWHHKSASTRGSLPYGSFCNSVRMFCGMVLAWATMAVPACCRIWALDSCEVACA